MKASERERTLYTDLVQLVRRRLDELSTGGLYQSTFSMEIRLHVHLVLTGEAQPIPSLWLQERYRVAS